MEPTSNNAQQSVRKSPSDKSDDDYLVNQIADARLALESTLDDLTLDLARAADFRRWVRRYPWAALGTALVAGFTLANVVTKSKRRDEATAPIDTKDEALRETKSGVAVAKLPRKQTPRQESAGRWRAAMIDALFDILRLAVTQFVSASVRQAATSASHPRPRPSHDGSAAPHSSSDAGPEATDQSTPSGN